MGVWQAALPPAPLPAPLTPACGRVPWTHPAAYYGGKDKVAGYNGLGLYEVANCWARDVSAVPPARPVACGLARLPPKRARPSRLPARANRLPPCLPARQPHHSCTS